MKDETIRFVNRPDPDRVFTAWAEAELAGSGRQPTVAAAMVPNDGMADRRGA